jgi:hypothetical protein
VAQLDERELATKLFNRCWDLLESTRNADDDVELLTAAFSSRFHWLRVGAIEQWITSDWMVARAAAATGDGELSLRFAERAHRAAQENAVPDWLVASTAEGVARAYAVTGAGGPTDRGHRRSRRQGIDRQSTG